MSEIIYSIRVDAALVRAFARSSYRSGTTAAERIRRFMAASISSSARNLTSPIPSSSGMSKQNRGVSSPLLYTRSSQVFPAGTCTV